MTKYSEKRNGISELAESIEISAHAECYDELVEAEKVSVKAKAEAKKRKAEVKKMTDAIETLRNLSAALTSLKAISGYVPEIAYDAEGVAKKIESLGLEGIVSVKKAEQNPAQQTTTTTG